MEWKKLRLPSGARLFRVHKFIFMGKTASYKFEVNEYHDGRCSGHGEQSNDPSQQVETVNGSSVEDCLQRLIDRVDHAKAG